MNSSSELLHDLSSTSHWPNSLTRNFRQGQTRWTRDQRVSCLSSLSFLFSFLLHLSCLPPHSSKLTPHPLNTGTQFSYSYPSAQYPAVDQSLCSISSHSSISTNNIYLERKIELKPQPNFETCPFPCLAFNMHLHVLSPTPPHPKWMQIWNEWMYITH